MKRGDRSATLLRPGPRLEMTLDMLSDTDAAARISESLAALGRGEPGAGMATVRRDLARHRVTGA
jgi:antitoxin YefM